jgi:hypothetical protein
MEVTAMSEQMAAKMYAELVEIRALLARIQDEVERLTQQLDQETAVSTPYDLTSLIGLGSSGLTDVSERHDYYVGEAIADENLH